MSYLIRENLYKYKMLIHDRKVQNSMPTEESQVISKSEREHQKASNGALQQAHADVQINCGDQEPTLLCLPTMYLN